MSIHYYLSVFPMEALIASQLDPSLFATYMATGSKKGSQERIVFFEIEGGFGSDFDWKHRVDLIVWNDLIRGDRDWQLQVGNSFTHQRQGQNVTYGDGHTSYEERSDIGVKHDNISTIIDIESENEDKYRKPGN